MIFTVDVHPVYQAGLNVEQVSREGYGALIVKATQGVSGYSASSVFDNWITRARVVGMITGAYHWLTAGDGSGQALRFYRRLANVAGPDGMLCAVDVEDPTHPPSWGDLVNFASEWEQLTHGHPLILYTGAWWWAPRGWTGANITPHLWASRYVAGTGTGAALYGKVPGSWWTPGYGGWPSATMLQFSSAGQVAGKQLDVSAFRGTAGDLRTLAGSTTPRQHRSLPMFLIRNGATIIGTDWDTWHDQTLNYEECLAMQAGGIPLVDVSAARMTEIISLPHARTPKAFPMVVMGDADRIAIAAEVASQLAPALRNVNAIADRLGAAGDALGTLNDPPV